MKAKHCFTLILPVALAGFGQVGWNGGKRLINKIKEQTKMEMR